MSWTVLDDFGMSYIVGLCDGSFVIIDGGFEFESDADRLMEHLLKLNDGKIPTAAAWIFTHPHIDYYRCFLEFHRKYKDRVKYETFIMNSSEINKDDCKINPIYVLQNEADYIIKLEEILSKTGCKIYMKKIM